MTAALQTTLFQVAYQIPPMLVFAAGILAGLVWYRRCPKAAGMCIAGCALMLLSVIAGAASQVVMIQSLEQANEMAKVRSTMAVVSFISILVRTGGLGLVVIAVFTGRDKPAEDQFL